MSRKTSLSVPTNTALSHTQRLPVNSQHASKALSRLTRQSLIELVLEWTDPKNRGFCQPFLTSTTDEDEDGEAPYVVASTLEEVREAYKELKGRKGGKQEVLDRILEGDWRRGTTLYQLAMADTRYLLDHPNSLRWNALKLSKVTDDGDGTASDGTQVIDDSTSADLPRFHATTFVLNLQKEVAPVTNAHYYMTRVRNFGISLLRVHVHDTPYNHPLHDASNATSVGSKSVFFVFPDGSPYVYVSLATNGNQTVGEEARSLRKVIVDAVPKALSKPHSRYALTTTSLSSRSLSTLLSLRGPGRSNAAPAGWSIFAENSFGHHTLDYDSAGSARRASDNHAGPDQDSDTDRGIFSGPVNGIKRGRTTNSKDDIVTKKRKKVAETRFGPSGHEDDGKGLEKLDIRMEDPFPATTIEPNHEAVEEEEQWTPDVRLSFQGSHVFAGVRQLVEQGVVDGEKMPGWMTGEAGVSVGVVRDGRIAEKS